MGEKISIYLAEARPPGAPFGRSGKQRGEGRKRDAGEPREEEQRREDGRTEKRGTERTGRHAAWINVQLFP